MRLRSDAQHWGTVTMILHWGMAFLMAVQLLLGALAAAWHLSPTKLELFFWHKSLGLLLLLLVLLRLAWRLGERRPELPASMAPWERNAARVVQALLYALLVLLPLSGWLVNAAAGIPFRPFGLFPLPAPVAADPALKVAAIVLHRLLWALFLSALVLHVGAALHHHRVRRDNVLRSMLPNGWVGP